MKIIGMVWNAHKFTSSLIVNTCKELSIIPSFKIVNEATPVKEAMVRTQDVKVVKEVAQQLPAIGAWTYITPWFPTPSAKTFVQAYQDCGADPDLFCINAEIEFKTVSTFSASISAKAYLESVKNSFPTLKRFFLSTFAQKSRHPDFPYNAFLRSEILPGILSGQCYGSNPKKQIDEMVKSEGASKEIFTAIFNLPPSNTVGTNVSPCLRLYKGDGRTNLDEINHEFITMIEYCESIKIPVVWFWSMDSLMAIPSNYKYAYNFLKAKKADTSHSITVPPLSVPPPSGIRPFLFGEKSTEVAALQTLINQRGYTPPLVLDGAFGPKTTQGFKAVFGPTFPSLWDES